MPPARMHPGSGKPVAADIPLAGEVIKDKAQDDSVEAVTVRRLLDAGLLSRRCVVDGSLRMLRTTGRNMNFVVTTGEGPAYLVKYGRGRDLSLRREAAAYSFLERVAGTELKMALPSVVARVRQAPILVLEYIDGRNLRGHHAQLGRCPVTWAQRCGALLAAVHEVPISAVPSALRARHGAPAFGAAIHRPDQTLFTTSSQAVVDLIALIQSDSALCVALDNLATDEASDAFTHQDVRWDNVLVARTAKGRLTGLRLVDWEGAVVGDPAWDVGCLFAEYLSHWVGSIPLTTIETVAQHVKLATFSLESAQRSIAASWAGYASSRTLGPVDAQHCLRRATRYVGYRLLQRALEMDQLSPVVSLVAACHVQLGARILAESDRAMTELLGFPSGSGISG